MAATAGPQDLSSPNIIKIIDELFKCGISEYIHLPQLVVVGNQSSGKSSVLEGISKFPFPRDSGLCTRFATQISFKWSHTTNTTVKIMPANNSSEEHKMKCGKWEASWDGKDPKAFAQIMLEVGFNRMLAGTR